MDKWIPPVKALRELVNAVENFNSVDGPPTAMRAADERLDKAIDNSKLSLKVYDEHFAKVNVKKGQAA